MRRISASNAFYTFMRFSENLTRLMALVPINQQQLAERMGVSQATVSRWENGAVPHRRTLNKLANLLGVSPKDLENGHAAVPHGLSLRAAAALADKGEGTQEQKQKTFEAVADHLLADRVSDWKLEQLRALLAQMIEVIDAPISSLKGPKILPTDVASNKRQPAKAKRAHRSDVKTVSLSVFGNIPAGWPQAGEGTQQPIRVEQITPGRFPEGAFGLEVRGESMNAAQPYPILDGEVVILLSPEQREPKSGDIVAALVDGETCLKRLVNGDQPAHLRSESTNPAFRTIHPRHDLIIQGVLIGKLKP